MTWYAVYADEVETGERIQMSTATTSWVEADGWKRDVEYLECPEVINLRVEETA